MQVVAASNSLPISLLRCANESGNVSGQCSGEDSWRARARARPKVASFDEKQEIVTQTDLDQEMPMMVAFSVFTSSNASLRRTETHQHWPGASVYVQTWPILLIILSPLFVFCSSK